MEKISVNLISTGKRISVSLLQPSTCRRMFAVVMQQLLQQICAARCLIISLQADKSLNEKLRN
jgi:hypothetical protein